jgi:eukaryotic-like serine/threonine-protein kinase
MPDGDHILDAIADAVANGLHVDWAEAARRLTTPEQHAMLESLRAISALATREITPDSHGTTSDPLAASGPAGRRRWLPRMARRVARRVLTPEVLIALTAIPLIALTVMALVSRGSAPGAVASRPIRAALLTVTGAGVVLLLARKRLVATLNRRKRSDPALELGLARITAAIRDAADARELADRVDPLVSQFFRVSGARLLTADATLMELVPVRPVCSPLPADSALVALLGDDDDVVPVAQGGRAKQYELLPARERHWLVIAGFAALAPLRGRTGGLVGVLGIGPKLSGSPFTRSELGALRAIAGPVALVLDRVMRRADSRPIRSAEVEGAAECRVCGRVQDPSSARCMCGGEIQTAAVPLLLAGKFQIERRLGRGGMGVTYLARDTTLDRLVAIKTLPRRSLTAIRGLDAEARAMATIVHPRLALIFGVEIWRAVPMLVMEYLPGGTLAQRLRREPMGVTEALEMGVALAEGLEALHQSGLLHRDLKASNIAFASNGQPKLLDFGLARLVADPTESVGDLAGTPLYLSPELTRGGTPAPSDDLWALSIVLYEAIAGHHPFAGGDLHDVLGRVSEAVVPDIRTFVALCPPHVAELFRGLLAPDVAARPGTARVLQGRLAAARTADPT